MSDLRPVHVDTAIDPGNQGKIIAAILVALVVLVMAGFAFRAGWFNSLHEPVPDSRLPQASMPLVPAKS